VHGPPEHIIPQNPHLQDYVEEEHLEQNEESRTEQNTGDSPECGIETLGGGDVSQGEADASRKPRGGLVYNPDAEYSERAI